MDALPSNPLEFLRVPPPVLANRIFCMCAVLPHGPRLLWQIAQSKMRGDGDAALVLKWLQSVNGHSSSGSSRTLLAPPADGCVRLFGWELSYFSGKIRGFLRYKAKVAGLRFDEVVATPGVISDVLFEATKSSAVPQVQLPDGRIVQDSKEIMDEIEQLYPSGPVLPDGDNRPCQRLVCQIIELLGDEWLLVPAFHWRWAYSGNGSTSQRMPNTGGDEPPSHREYNELQWGTFLRPDGSDAEKCRTARWLFDNVMLTEIGVKDGMRCLGVSWDTVAAWEASCKNVLQIFEAHLAVHDYVLGGRPSTADFGLLGPLYAHLYKDPVPGEMIRRQFPLVAKWIVRCHDGLVGRSDNGDWLPDDDIPESILPMLGVFFSEMWPVLQSSCHIISRYLASTHNRSNPLPGKSFSASHPDQMRSGPLVHNFTLPFDKSGRPGGTSHGRRMVLPYQVWMLQRLEPTIQQHSTEVGKLLRRVAGGMPLLDLSTLLDGCRVRKQGGRIYALNGANPTAARSWTPVWLVLACLALYIAKRIAAAT